MWTAVSHHVTKMCLCHMIWRRWRTLWSVAIASSYNQLYEICPFLLKLLFEFHTFFYTNMLWYLVLQYIQHCQIKVTRFIWTLEACRWFHNNLWFHSSNTVMYLLVSWYFTTLLSIGNNLCKFIVQNTIECRSGFKCLMNEFNAIYFCQRVRSGCSSDDDTGIPNDKNHCQNFLLETFSSIISHKLWFPHISIWIQLGPEQLQSI